MANTQYWLFKSESSDYSIDNLQSDGRTHWDGVRNHQVRNYMRDNMRVGDRVLFYHSNSNPIGVAGLARICRTAYPDHTALDPTNPHFDARSTKADPIWLMVDIEFEAKFREIVTLDRLRATKDLDGLLVLKRGQRLSIMPVEQRHFARIEKLGMSPAK
ncbi:MAG: EVE domain-containing protein [Phycisphaerae bacterium]|nr:EVE domain-containing protein [Phycisphaerae bacterium]